MKSLALILAVAGAASASADPLPGTLYFVQDGALAKRAGGVVVTGFTDVGAPVFPSQLALPDGRLVGIASRGDGEPGSEQLVLIGPGTKVERIGPATTQVRDPAVDRAGKWIVIEAKLEAHSELYKIDVATQKSTRLTTNKQGNFAPATIDARSIVFASSRDGDSELYKLDVATKKAKRLTAFHKDDWSPRPSPDGKTIAFLSDRTGKPTIFLVGADGTNLRALTEDAGHEEADPVWSPDGKSVAYIRTRVKVQRESKDVVVGGPPPSELVVHEIGKAKQRVLTTGAADPVWSPDGRWIAVTQKTDIIAVPLSGAAAVVVAKHARLPRWR